MVTVTLLLLLLLVESGKCVEKSLRETCHENAADASEPYSMFSFDAAGSGSGGDDDSPPLPVLLFPTLGGGAVPRNCTIMFPFIA